MLNSNYNLQSLLTSYSETLDKYKDIKALNPNEKIDLIKEKDASAHTLMNVILSGVEKLNPSQIQSLQTFHRIHKENDRDRVVQLVGQVLQSSPTFPTQKETTKLPKEIKSIVHTFKNASDLKYLPIETQKQVVVYAFSRLMDAGKDRNEVHYASDLVQFIKIISMHWDSIPDQHDEIVQCLRNLIQIHKQEGIQAGEFNELAIIVIDKGTMIPDDIQKIPYYHGQLIQKGVKNNETRLSYNSQASQLTTLQFIEEYCKEKLRKNEYLLRSSSSAPSTDDAAGISYFPVTLSVKYTGGQIEHFRLTRREDNGIITWQRGVPSESNFKEQLIYPTLDECIGDMTEGNFTPCLLHKPFVYVVGTAHKWNI